MGPVVDEVVKEMGGQNGLSMDIGRVEEAVKVAVKQAVKNAVRDVVDEEAAREDESHVA